MPFEPDLSSTYAALFHGHISTGVTDPDGEPASTIISMNDKWHLQVNWQVHGSLIPSIGGKWKIRAYLEALGPGPEVLVADRTINMTGNNNYSETFIIGPGIPNQEGAYRLVTVLTSTNLLGGPAPFAAFDEGGILQFFEGDNV